MIIDVPVELAEPLQRIADEAHVPVEEVYSVALAQALSLWGEGQIQASPSSAAALNLKPLLARGNNATREKFAAVLSKVPSSEPLKGDEL